MAYNEDLIKAAKIQCSIINLLLIKHSTLPLLARFKHKNKKMAIQ
jgi:hypothetical protein